MSGMILNNKKTKLIYINKQERQSGEVITCEGEQLEWVKSCDYLGIKITNNGKIDEEILHRISQASKVYYSLNHTIINKKKVSKKVKLQVYNSSLFINQH